MSLADAVIPRTVSLAEIYGNVMYYGALDQYTDEYLVMILNYFPVPLAVPVAQMLELAAEEFIPPQGRNQREAADTQENPLFVLLTPEDRFRILTLLERTETGLIGEAFLQEYPGLVSAISSLIRYTMLGYYSEWFGYGSTRLEAPNQRTLQYHPISWEQVGYPGPSFSYIAEVQQYYQLRRGAEINNYLGR
jgi:hypothetical protein